MIKQGTAWDRAQVGGWASIIGTAFLVLGVLLFLVSGDLSGWVFACVLIAVIAFGLWIGLAPGEFQAWIGGRQTRLGTSSVLVTILFLGFLTGVFVVIDRANLTVDLTSVQRYSLNAPTLDTIDQLKAGGDRVRIIGFFTRFRLREQEAADLLLRQYEDAGDGAIEIEFIDPDERPDTASRYGYQSGYDGNLFLAMLGPNGEPDLSTPPLYLGGVNERDITSGIKTIASAGSIKVYFTIGHGERSIEGGADDLTGISRLYNSLVGQGISVESLSLLQVSDTGIPGDADAVLIIGATSPFTAAEVQVIADYMARGGRLAIFADPPYIDLGTGNTFLTEGDPLADYLWNEFGVRAQERVVLEYDYSIGSEFSFIPAQILPHDRILDDVPDAQVVLQLVRPIELADNPSDIQGGYVREPLFYSSENSEAGGGLEAMQTTPQFSDTISGPFVLAVTVRRSLEFQLEEQPRLFLIGDSDVLKNEFVAEIQGNVFFWTDIMNWLTGFVEELTFTPVSDPTRLPLIVTDQQRTTIATITLVILPGAVLLSGVGVWLYRRR
jgi:hypothetical protein